MSKHRTKLSEHIFKKGKFITPFNNALGDVMRLQSWSSSRLPEYFWIALLINFYTRERSAEILPLILIKLHKLNENIILPMFSQVLKLETEKQEEFFKYLRSIIDPIALAPLSLVYTYTQYPIFSKIFCAINIPFTKRQELLEKTLEKCFAPQSEFTTDIKYWVIYMFAQANKLILSTECKGTLEALQNYIITPHSDERMRTYRPAVRSLEGVISSAIFEKSNNEGFLNDFWERVSIMSDCKLFTINFENKAINSKVYVEKIKEIFSYLTNLFKVTMPLDKKAMVIIGLATYAYKRVLEVEEHNLHNSIAGRSATRVLVEIYIMLKYLLKKEYEKSNIWEDFQEYGIGQLKTIVARSRDYAPKPNSHVEYKFLELIVNQYKKEEFIDMDTSYFDKQNIREKANFVGEKELYGLYYDYDSAFEHGLWGAIIESSLLPCNNPAHQYHYVPDYNNVQKLKSIWPDCIMLMNKIVEIVDTEYKIPKNLLEEIKNFE